MNEQSEPFDGDNEPLYNIGAVSRMTDVAETTLRVWERRYDFPNSSRTDGGHRLYSQNEVNRLQWVKSRVDEGMQISQAIKALHHTEQEGRAVAAPMSLLTSPINGGENLSAFYDRLLNALLKHDTVYADRIIAEALTVYSLEHLILHLISPIMNEIGSLWESDDIDIASEHFITNYLRHRLLQWMRTAPPKYNVNEVILACAPGELHEGSLLMLGVLLSRLRWPVSYLGQSIALAGFDGFIEQVHPSIIVFVAMTEQSAQDLAKWPDFLPKAYESNQPLVCFGGRIFNEQPDYIDYVAGTYLGQSIEAGILTLDKLLHDMFPHPR